MMRSPWLAPAALAVLLAGCAGEDSRERGAATSEEDSRLEYSAPAPSESRPIPQGFTHRPPPGTQGLPPPAPPLLTPEEERGYREARDSASEAARRQAQEELLSILERFEREEDPLEGRDALRAAVVDRLSRGLVPWLTADELHERYRFPNEERAQSVLQGTLVALTGTVAPHSMLDPADGFKVFDQAPYVHQPVLLATEHELSFVRCLLARPELQKLRDWEEAHFVGVVSGKERTDVVLRRCVVL